MPNIKIKNTSPNILSKSILPIIRNINRVPNILNKNLISHPRIVPGGSVSVVTTGSANFGGAGYLIGMMALTYTQSQGSQTTTKFISDLKPNIRIKND